MEASRSKKRKSWLNNFYEFDIHLQKFDTFEGVYFCI
jgi:hypothetical protein